jgi:N-acetylglucosamine kinase-like BadF-type ATPase
VTPPPLLLGLDAGGSGSKWTLWRDGEVRAAGVAPAFTAALLDTPAGAAALRDLAAGLPASPDGVHAGVPGLSRDSGRAAQVGQALALALGLSAGQVSVEGDLDLAYRAHLSHGAGVLLYAGTGSVAYHVTAAGEVVRAGGRGYRIGDDGGGFDLGRHALRTLTDALDAGTLDPGQPPATPLAREVAAITGGLDWPTLRAFAYGTPGAAALARLAPAVGRAADQGDPDATRIVTQAAASLAELARRVLARTGPLPVTATGGALRITALFGAALGRALPGATVQHRDHAQAAARYRALHHG